MSKYIEGEGVGGDDMRCLHCGSGEIMLIDERGNYHNVYWCQMCGSLSHFYLHKEDDRVMVPRTCVVDF